MSNNPYESSDVVGDTPIRAPGYWRYLLTGLLAIVAIAGLLIALILPATRGPMDPRVYCGIRLQQIAIALRTYEMDYHALPPAYTVDAEGKPLHSWRTLILPYLGEQLLYEKIDLAKPWDDPANREAYETALDEFCCPSADCPRNHTTYFGVVAPDGCFLPAEPRELSDITDDHGSTLMLIEMESERHAHWMSPTGAGEQWILDLSEASQLPHPGGFHAAFVDFRVHFVRLPRDPAQRRAMISINGNDDAVVREADLSR
jgi:hypothetical protein